MGFWTPLRQGIDPLEVAGLPIECAVEADNLRSEKQNDVRPSIGYGVLGISSFMLASQDELSLYKTTWRFCRRCTAAQFDVVDCYHSTVDSRLKR